MRPILLLVLNLLTLIFTLIMNYQGSSGALTGRDVGEVSDAYANLITPAGYAFSIWGLIYTGLIAFVVFQWYIWLKEGKQEDLQKAGLWFTLSNIANGLWIVAWVSDWIGLSVVLMFLLLFCLVRLVVLLRLEMWDAPVREIMFVWWPITIYLGWIIVASVTNVAAYLVSLGYDGAPLGEREWTVLLLLVATLIYLLLTYYRNLREAGMVGAWAFLAIAVARWESNTTIAYTAVGCAIVLVAAGLYHGALNQETSPFKKLQRGEWR